MEAQISDIATNVGGFVLHPLVVATLAVATLALITGVAGRAALIFEDLRQRRRGSPADAS